MDEAKIRALVDEQAADEGLWFEAQTCAEAYVQQALRRLHAVIEEDNRPLSEIFAEFAEQWVDADAAANLLEDCKSAFLAEKMLIYADLPVNKAEMNVKGSPEWRDYIEKTVAARKQANLLKVRMETIRMKFNEWQSQEANERVQARL